MIVSFHRVCPIHTVGRIAARKAHDIHDISCIIRSVTSVKSACWGVVRWSFACKHRAQTSIEMNIHVAAHYFCTDNFYLRDNFSTYDILLLPGDHVHLNPTFIQWLEIPMFSNLYCAVSSVGVPHTMHGQSITILWHQQLIPLNSKVQRQNPFA